MLKHSIARFMPNVCFPDAVAGTFSPPAPIRTVFSTNLSRITQIKTVACHLSSAKHIIEGKSDNLT